MIFGRVITPLTCSQPTGTRAVPLQRVFSLDGPTFGDGCVVSRLVLCCASPAVELWVVRSALPLAEAGHDDETRPTDHWGCLDVLVGVVDETAIGGVPGALTGRDVSEAPCADAWPLGQERLVDRLPLTLLNSQ